MKKLVITTAALFALVCAGWAGGGWGANDDPNGGGFWRGCDPVTHLNWAYDGSSWHVVGTC